MLREQKTSLTRRIPSHVFFVIGGVQLLTDVRLSRQPPGFPFAFATCAFSYAPSCLAAGSLKMEAVGIDRLGAAMLIALVTITPPGLGGALPDLTYPLLVLAGVGVGVCSSVIPSVCDQLTLARLPQATIALLLSLLLVSVTVIRVVVVRQIPSPLKS